ncbi:hypothetical protein HJFPF1_01811 [Paramyrothecium foliicola]|nr:hypothetical protein HJFPF1_01811 [Paramyrothecium foliicola]
MGYVESTRASTLSAYRLGVVETELAQNRNRIRTHSGGKTTTLEDLHVEVQIEAEEDGLVRSPWLKK